MKPIKYILAALVIPVIIGCSSGAAVSNKPVTHTQTTQAVTQDWKTVARNADDSGLLKNLSDDTLQSIADSTCTAFADGLSADQIIATYAKSLEDNNVTSAAKPLGILIAVAVQAQCPQYSDDLLNAASDAMDSGT